MDDSVPSTSAARHFSDVAFSRNLGIITPGEQDMLARAKVGIPGLGGVGGMHCITLARLGVGGFHLADPDTFELANFNRQYGATVRHLGQAKLDSMVEEARQINPHLDIRPFPEGLTAQNLDDFLSGLDVVVDGLDFFAFDIRRALFNRACEMGVPVVTAAPLGFTSSVLVFTPESMSFDDYFAISDDLSRRERLLRFGVGLAPRGLHLSQMDKSRISLDHGRGPSLNIACQLCAALAATEAVRIITGRPGLKATPWSFQVDPLSGKSCRARLRKGNASLMQRAKLWYVRNILLGNEGAALRHKHPAPEPCNADAKVGIDHLTWLAQAAQQAPSGDNCQPWRFQIEDAKLRILLEPREDQSFFNVSQLASVIACGAAAQNVVCAAPEIGCAATVSIMPEPSNQDVMADIVVEPKSLMPNPLADAVWIRTTNRRMYTRREVEQFSQNEMTASAGPAKLFLVNDRDGLKALGKLLYKADRIRVERRDLHEHFIRMTRFAPPDGAGCDDGLPLKNLYAGAAGEVFLRLTRPWAAMQTANRLGVGKLVALHSQQSMEKSPLAGLVCVESPSREDFLKGGMALERVWLTATRHGLAFQPMTAITLFWLRWHLEGPQVFSTAHQALLEGIWPQFRNLFPALGENCWPLLLFRAGHAKPIEYWTPRRNAQFQP
ncbi:MAG: UBA/THIF-type NAD/FAD binding [Desulfovibrionaceae bacterium]|nr:MAG: UBA/THIF-type NAD/FAD binding [Desulfovibrionaceae bacterium]